jgi:hypothetical protein
MYTIHELGQMNVNNFDKEIICTIMYTYVEVLYFQL